MAAALQDRLLKGGAVLDGETHAPLHFGAPEAELQAALRLSVLTLRGNLDRILARGEDILDLLHRLSTADLRALAPGDGLPTVLTSPKGRIVERLFVHRLGDDGVLLVASGGAAGRVVAHLDRYTFAEKTALEDVTQSTCQLGICGPLAAETLQAAGLARPAPYGSSVQPFEGSSLWVLGHDGWSADGFSVVCPASIAGSVWQSLVLAVARSDGRAAGMQAMEAYRILRGLPAAGSELNEHHNPLEAGLEAAISFDKGCYVGQEVVARLRTYDKISRSLLGLDLARGGAVPSPGSALYAGGREVGRVTSATLPPGWDHPVGLAYLKRKHVGPGDEVHVGAPDAGDTARIVALPFEGT